MSIPSLHVGGTLAAAPSNEGRTFSPLSDAVVLLRAATAADEGWTSAAVWRNEGTGGTAFDAEVGDITATLGAGRMRVQSGTDVTLSGFEIANGDIWNPTIGTDGLTIAHDWQPLDVSDSKAYWHYTGVDLQTTGYGFVSEELDFGDPYHFYVWSANDAGPGNPGTIGATVAPSLARRIDVARIEGNTLTVFRDGAVAATFDLTGRGPITESAPFRLGNPCDHYAFAAWDRALSDADVALLSAGFPVVP